MILMATSGGPSRSRTLAASILSGVFVVLALALPASAGVASYDDTTTVDRLRAQEAVTLPAPAGIASYRETTTIDRLRAQETATLKDTSGMDRSPSRDGAPTGSEWQVAAVAALLAATAAVVALGITATRRRLRTREI